MLTVLLYVCSVGYEQFTLVRAGLSDVDINRAVPSSPLQLDPAAAGRRATAPALNALYFDIAVVANVTDDDETQALLFALSGLANSVNASSARRSVHTGTQSAPTTTPGAPTSFSSGPSAVLLDTGHLDLDFPDSDARWRDYLEVSDLLLRSLNSPLSAS
jgi:hypothetical protein